MRSSPVQVGTGFYRVLGTGSNATTVIDPYVHCLHGVKIYTDKQALIV